MSFELKVTGDINKDRRVGHYMQVGDDPQQYDISVSHQQGGMNFFTYKTEARGFYLSVTPVERGDGFVSFTGFSGNKILLEENKRFNRKRFNEIISEVFENPGEHEDVIRVLDHVMRKNGKANPSATPVTV
jgi:hypothetical protein